MLYINPLFCMWRVGRAVTYSHRVCVYHVNKTCIVMLTQQLKEMFAGFK